MLDYDGVLVDSLAINTKTFVRAMQIHGCDKVRTESDLAALCDINMYQKMREYGMDDVSIHNVLSDYEDMLSELEHHADIFPGIKELVTQSSKKFNVYIVTSNLETVVDKTLKSQGAVGYLDIFGAKADKSKINKIRNLKAMFPNKRSYYVGDTTGDIFEAREAGASTIGAGWGWHGAVKLATAEPDYIFNKPVDLLAFLLEQQ